MLFSQQAAKRPTFSSNGLNQSNNMRKSAFDKKNVALNRLNCWGFRIARFGLIESDKADLIHNQSTDDKIDYGINSVRS